MNKQKGARGKGGYRGRLKKPTLASMLAEARAASGLSLRRLAERVESNFSYLADLEKGAYTNPSASLVMRLAEALEIDEKELLELAGHDYLLVLPEFPVYLRTKYHLSDEALKHMKDQWEFARERYDIDDKQARDSRNRQRQDKTTT